MSGTLQRYSNSFEKSMDKLQLVYLINFLINPKFSPWSSPVDCHPLEHLASRPRRRCAGTQPRNTRIARAVVSWKKSIIITVWENIFFDITTIWFLFFFFFFVFWLLHLRKLVKNDVSFAIYLSKSGEIKRRGADGPDAID